KGPWRWYHERALECCKPLHLIEKDGLDFDEWVCLARFFFLSYSSFFLLVERHARSSGKSEALVVSYSRGAMGQTGDGHFAPLGGYHREKDLCLVLDTARFKYPPHWVRP
ncbi:Phytochelatin synthase, partial [Pavlovales sp. CCMP2436]